MCFAATGTCPAREEETPIADARQSHRSKTIERLSDNTKARFSLRATSSDAADEVYLLRFRRAPFSLQQVEDSLLTQTVEATAEGWHITPEDRDLSGMLRVVMTWKAGDPWWLRIQCEEVGAGSNQGFRVQRQQRLAPLRFDSWALQE